MGMQGEGIVARLNNLDVLTLGCGFANAAGAAEYFVAGSIRCSFQIAEATLVMPFGVDGELELVAFVKVNSDGEFVVAGLFQLVGIGDHLAPVGGKKQISLSGANDCPSAGVLLIGRESGKHLGILGNGFAEIKFHALGGSCKPAHKGLTFFFGCPRSGCAALGNFLCFQDGVTVHVLHGKLRFLRSVGAACKQG